jgi:hypothetical protein
MRLTALKRRVPACATPSQYYHLTVESGQCGKDAVSTSANLAGRLANNYRDKYMNTGTLLPSESTVSYPYFCR